MTLSVARGTYAERWAKDHNVRYTSREPEETITVSSGSSSATSVDDQNKVSEKLVAKSDRTDVTMEGYDPSDSNAIDKGGKASGEKAGVENKQGNEQEVAPNQGRCGEAVTWSLDESGNLIIDGNGKMYDYSDDRPAPWAELSKRIVSIHIGPKVETVGAYAFAGLDKVKAVAFDDGSELTEIHDFAFSGCKTLREIELPKKVAKIGQGAFERCENLEIVGLPESVISIGEVLVEQESKQPTAGQASVDAFAGSPLVKVEAEKVFARSQFPSWYNHNFPPQSHTMVFARSQFPSWYNVACVGKRDFQVFARSQFPSWYNSRSSRPCPQGVFARSQFPSWYNSGVTHADYYWVFARSQFPSWYNMMP